MKVALMSDTHDYLRPEVKQIISECDGVIHAGDVCSPKIVEEIKALLGTEKTLYLVRGNNDRTWAKEIPACLKFTIQNVTFLMVHNKKDVPNDLEDVDIVIYGHSHKYADENKEGKRWLNPGSCGKKRFHLPATMAILHFSKDFYVEKIQLDSTEERMEPSVNLTEGKLVEIVTEIFVRMDKGQTISYIASKVGMDSEMVEQICRIRVTHPGVTPGGVVDKMEVNRVVIKSSKTM